MIEFTLAELRLMKIIIEDVSFIKESDFTPESIVESHKRLKKSVLNKIEYKIEEIKKIR